MQGHGVKASRRRESGQTVIITAVAMVAMLSMAVLAIDVVTLYVSAGDAQKAADFAALAGAKAFVSSGFTSGQLGWPLTGAPESLVCNGSSGLADLQAQAAAQQILIAGTAPTVTTSCDFSSPENPQITVRVTRTGLPTFFARVFGYRSSSVSGTASAEAYNPSGSAVPIQVQSVKPWLISNCNPTTAPPCSGSSYFVDPSSNYALNNPTTYIGQHFIFTQAKAVPKVGGYYALDLPQATTCPSPAAPPGSCSLVGSGNTYLDNIACANTAQLSCGSIVNIDPNTNSAIMRTSTMKGTQCLIHTNANGNPKTGCSTDLDPDCFESVSGSPVSIDGGVSNPNPAMRVLNISRSDSIVTVPIFDYQSAAENPCPGGVCGSATVIGFLQLGIQRNAANGNIGAFVLNAAGCDPGGSGTAVSGGGLSPIPVRLDN